MEHGHHHGRHSGHAAHQPAPDSMVAYTRAYEAAQPEAGRRVVAVELEARETPWEIAPGRAVTAWGYNGQVPGPVIEAEVGDVLSVRLRNALPEATNIHWHGLRLPSPMDGTEDVQRPVEPGEAFEYRFRLPDAGTFWYHPHLNETVQLERGLYGALVVRGPDEPRLDRERVLVLDDVRLDRAGRIAETGGWLERHDGRQGDVRLVGGMTEPELMMSAGQVERWRIVNASSARYVRLSIGGRPFQLLGTDGGLIERPVTMTDVLLTPADRVDVAVGPFRQGEVIRVESLPYNRGVKKRKTPGLFATLHVGPPAPSTAEMPERLRTIEPLVRGAVAANREVVLSGRMKLRGGPDFLVNREQHHRAEPVRVGELQVWDIVNESPIDHPFHLHGFFFQVLEVNGEPPDFLSWEDTVNVPKKGRVRIAWLPDDRRGPWMYHCHILEHHAAGMMAHFEVVR